jgi:hypothetical protein
MQDSEKGNFQLYELPKKGNFVSWHFKAKLKKLSYENFLKKEILQIV